MVESNGPADKAGVLVGDILTGLGDTPVEQTDDLQTYCDSDTIGRSIKIKLIRGGALKELALTVGERPGRPS
jgi:S1-C subfamily serine protease